MAKVKMIEIGGKVKTTKVLVEGIVQGVGFRPFVYRIATELELSGYVRNLGNVVEIIIHTTQCTNDGGIWSV